MRSLGLSAISNSRMHVVGAGIYWSVRFERDIHLLDPLQIGGRRAPAEFLSLASAMSSNHDILSYQNYRPSINGNTSRICQMLQTKQTTCLAKIHEFE